MRDARTVRRDDTMMMAELLHVTGWNIKKKIVSKICLHVDKANDIAAQH